MANKIKSKYRSPKTTEFTPRDLVVDVKNGKLYYKSNYAIYQVQATLFSTAISSFEESLNLGAAQESEVIFNNAGVFDGVDDFTVTLTTDSSGDLTGNGLVSMGSASISSVNIDGGTIDNLSSFSVDGPVEFHHITMSGVLSASNADVEHVLGGDISLKNDSTVKIEKFSDIDNLGFFTGRIPLLSPLGIMFTSSMAYAGTLDYNLPTDTDDPIALRVDHISSHADKVLVLTSDNGYYNTTNKAVKIRNEESLSDPAVQVYGGLKIFQGVNNPGSLKALDDVIAFASDKRLKENIINISDPLNKIKQLRGVYFDWKKETKELGFNPPRKKEEIGMIAQEVEKVIPQAIEPAPFDDNYKTIKYDRIIPLLVECINEQQKQIDNLKKLIK